MSSVSDAGSGGAWRRSGTCGRMGWTPMELLAMVLGFIVYWPIGVGIVLWKMARRRGAVGDDFFAAAREKFAGLAAAGGFSASGARADGSGFGAAPSGNTAFDAWRKGEIERLEEERRKLDEARREFAAFVEEARRSKDQEEFERFMARRSSPET